MLNKYETVFIIDPSIEQEQIDSIIEDVQNLVSGSGGKVIGVDRWGKKRLAYEVKGNRDGYYVLMNFEAESQFIQRLGRYYGLTEEIIKHMTLRAGGLSEVKTVLSRDEDEKELVSDKSKEEEDEK